MSPDTTHDTPHPQRTIKEYLRDADTPVEQDELLSDLTTAYPFTRGDVLSGLRVLMQENHVSYTIDYELQLDSRGEPHFPVQHSSSP